MTSADLNGLSDGGVSQKQVDSILVDKYSTDKKRKEAKDLGPSEIAEMVFDMMINHRIMESRIEKLENRLNTILSNGFIEKKAV